MEKLSVVGKRVPRVYAWEKVTGRAKYADDVELPKMLHAKIFRSKYAHARTLEVDTSEAEKLPGVEAVITAMDMPKDIPLEVLYNEFQVLPPYSLATDKARYTGEEIAAVAASREGPDIHILNEPLEGSSVFLVKTGLSPASFSGLSPLIHTTK